jgi:hypothetical protein
MLEFDWVHVGECLPLLCESRLVWLGDIHGSGIITGLTDVKANSSKEWCSEIGDIESGFFFVCVKVCFPCSGKAGGGIVRGPSTM